MNIEIKPEEIDIYVKNAIMNSSIGKMINESCQKYLKEMLDRYDSPVRNIIQQVVRDMLEAELNKEENKQIITEAFNKSFNARVMERVIGKTVEGLNLRFDSI